jgi:hypothetical protein
MYSFLYEGGRATTHIRKNLNGLSTSLSNENKVDDIHNPPTSRAVMFLTSTEKPTPPTGHVHLVLFEQTQESFYLEIPVAVIGTVCLQPCKYLRYLGWCVLGVEGWLQDEQGHTVDPNGNLVNQGIYHYRLPADHQGFTFTFHCRPQGQKLTTPQMSSFTLSTLKSSSCAAK